MHDHAGVDGRQHAAVVLRYLKLRIHPGVGVECGIDRRQQRGNTLTRLRGDRNRACNLGTS
jgi:hypothetical protein